MNVFARLKMLRHHQGHTQEAVARLIGVSVPAYCKMECGVTDLNYSRIMQLAALYQLTPAQLLDPEHDPFENGALLRMASLRERLAEKDLQLSELQRKVIALYEQLGAEAVKKTA